MLTETTERHYPKILSFGFLDKVTCVIYKS